MPTKKMPSNSRVQKCISNRRKLNRTKVLKILAAAMENVDGEAAGPSTSTEGGNLETGDEFFNTGRVGRRNALPDILSSHATISTADLPDQLSALSTTDKNVASTSSSSVGIDIQPTASTSQITTTSNS